MVTALEEDGLTDLAIPWPLLGGFLLLAAVAGVLAAVAPGAPSGPAGRAQGHRHRVTHGVESARG